jgi:hypothetical protein
MPQFKECTVDELLRDSLIDFSLKHNNRELFGLLTGEGWKEHVVKEEKYNKNNENNLHNKGQDTLTVFDTLATLTKNNNKYDLNHIYTDWVKANDNLINMICNLKNITLEECMDYIDDDEIK